MDLRPASNAAAAPKIGNPDDSLFTHLEQARAAWTTELKRWMQKSPQAFASGWGSYADEDRITFSERARSVLEALNLKA